MRLSDAATRQLDQQTEHVSVDGSTADDLFAVVDVLHSSASLQRSLTNPAVGLEPRQELARRVFGGKVSEPALEMLNQVLSLSLPDGSALPQLLERQAVRALLRTHREQIATVAHELHAFSEVVAHHPELSDALRNRTLPVERRRGLVTKLLNEKAHPVTIQLIERATSDTANKLMRTIDRYVELAAGLMHQQIARVTVAQELTAEQTARLQRALETQQGGPVTLQIDVDPSVLGGMNIDMGDTHIESTIAGRLADARRLLKTSPSKVGRND